MKKRILISTGGTGGHVIPAIAFYEHLNEEFDVILTSDKRGSKFIDENKFKVQILSAPRPSLNLIELPIFLISSLISILKSIFFLKNRKINILLTTGGYMSVPICIAAKILNLKVFLFEPNRTVGRANKFLIKFCHRMFCYFDEIDNFPIKYKYKIIVIDKILRKEIYKYKDYNKEKIENKINLLIIGGSQGAKIFDKQIKNAIINLSKKNNLKVYHQISSSYFNEMSFFYKENNIENKLFNFDQNIFQYIQQSNLAITRSGASTLSELVFLRIPFIAVPYKYATDDHQLKNALYYKNNGCCWILNENEISIGKLNELLVKIIDNKEDYMAKKKNLEKFCYQNDWNIINKKIMGFFK